MPATRDSWALIVLGTIASSSGCRGAAFVCSDDEQCQREGEMGICQPDGYCSFADPTCPSGQRYAEHAAKGLAKTCVPEETGDTGQTGETGSTSTTPGTTSTEDPPSSGTTSSSSGSSSSDHESSSATDTTTGHLPSTTGDDAAESSSSSSTGEPEPCSFQEDFEGGAFVNPWSDEGDLDLVFWDGMVGWELVASTEPLFGWTFSESQDLSGRSVEVEIGVAPPPAGNAQLLFELYTPQLSYFGMVEGSWVIVRESVDGAWVTLAEELYDPDESLRLSVTDMGGDFRWEVANGGSPELLVEHEISMDFDVTGVHVGLVGGTWKLEAEVGFIGFSWLRVCP